MYNEFLVAIFVLLLCIYFKWKYSYWSRKKVDGPPPIPIFGNLFDYVATKLHYGLIYDDIYKSFPKANYVGFYKLSNPAILIRDLELAKDILVSDFSTFHDNDFIVDEKLDPLMSKNPFVMTGETWKKGRNHLTPIFSSVKIKNCFPLINEVCDKLIECIEGSPEANSPDGFDAKDLCSRYTVQVISSCAFGVQTDALYNKQSEFWTMTTGVLKPTIGNMIKQGISLFMPAIGKWFKIPFISKEYDQWLRAIILDVVKNRDTKNEIRNDFIQTVLQLRDKLGADVINEDYVVGYSLTFMTEGYETSSTLMSFVLYDLASNPDILRRVQTEIDEVLKRHNGKLTYEAVLEMTYLEKVCYETLRVHPPVLALMKLSNRPYKLPQQYTDDPKYPKTVEIPANTTVIINAYSIHFDSEIFNDPFKYDPERFSEENKQARHKYSFLSFGEGPRICMGMKLGLTQSKAGLATMLSKYNVKVSPKTNEPLQISSMSFLLSIEGGIWINFEKRNN